MCRINGLLVTAIFAVLASSAWADSTAGTIPGSGDSSNNTIAGVYNSSLDGPGDGSGQGVLPDNNLGTSGNGFLLQGHSAHQFALRVPVPVVPEVPEPSTLTLFGSGLIIFGGAVRRRFRS